jgi:hypothetical protein
MCKSEQFVGKRDASPGITSLTTEAKGFAKTDDGCSRIVSDDFAGSVEHPETGDQTVFDLIHRAQGAPPTSYEFRGDQREHSENMTKRLPELGHNDGILAEGAPKRDEEGR